jgi:sulfotransferase
MVRDLRSIYASMEKNYRKSPERDPGIVNWSTMEGTNTAKRVEQWSKGAPVGIGIERLKSMIDQGIINNCLVVRYEDLLIKPQEEMNRVYNYLELEPFEHDFDNIEQLTQEDDSVYGIYGDHVIRPKLEYFDPKFEEVLGKDICEGIVNSYRWFYEYFDY